MPVARRFIAFGALLLLAACRASPAPSRGGRPPNIVLIVADDLGYRDLGSFGGTAIRTPHLDRMAAEGLRLTSFYVTASVCTPSRGSLLTGRYPHRNGLYEMIRNDMVNYGHRFTAEEYARSPEMTLGMDLREVMVSQSLRDAGYATGVVGKWDGGRARRYLPLQRGFDFYYGFANTGIDYYTHERYGIPSMFRGNDPVREPGYATDLFRREAVRFVRQNAARPFFLYFAPNAPHASSNFEKLRWQAPEELVRLYGDPPGTNETLYRASVTALDAAVGEILRTVRDLGLDAETLVLFMSDNGGSGPASNGELRGKKGHLFEGGVRVPLIARWPGRVPAGRASDAFASALDLFPTFLALAGAPPPRGVVLDGFDLTGVLLEGRPSPRERHFWEWRGARAARVGEWKWVDSKSGGGLFDLGSDLEEKNDLSARRPDVLARLQEAWAAWKREMDASEPRGPFRDH